MAPSSPSTHTDEPGGTGISATRRSVAGSMRDRTPFMSLRIQILSALAAIPPSLNAEPTAVIVADTLFVFGSMRARPLPPVSLPHNGTQIEPNAATSPEHGRSPTSISVTTVFVFGSSRPTMFLRPLVTHTASSVTTCQSGLPGIGNTAIGLMAATSRFTPGVLTPGRGGRAGRAAAGALSAGAAAGAVAGAGAGACSCAAASAPPAMIRTARINSLFTYPPESWGERHAPLDPLLHRFRQHVVPALDLLPRQLTDRVERD